MGIVGWRLNLCSFTVNNNNKASLFPMIWFLSEFFCAVPYLQYNHFLAKAEIGLKSTAILKSA